MASFTRQPTKILAKRLAETPEHIIVIAGPRQIGKTTAVRQVLAEREKNSFVFHAVDAPESEPMLLDLMQSEDAGFALPIPPSQRGEKWLIAEWEKARKRAAQWQEEQLALWRQGALGQAPTLQNFVLVFDEIHIIRNWSSTFKGLWDQDRANKTPMHVVVLGSAPLLMQENISESLMGRYETIHMTHWSFAEMRDCFDFTLKQYIYFGGYPGPAKWAHSDEVRWRDMVKFSLVEPNLVKDILALAKIEKPALLRQLFVLGCAYSGQIVAVNKLLSQLEDAGNTTTLSHYLNLLHASGLLTGLYKYAHDTTRQRTSKPKLNVRNTAFLSLYSRYTFAQAQEQPDFWGRLVESCIGAHLINTADGMTHIHYWSDSPWEVDFVVVQGRRLAALEVKSGPIKPSANKGLLEFQKKHADLPHIELVTHMVGGSDEALVDALCRPASAWLEE